MAEPFTIRVFVADGDPEGIRLIDRLNWTGIGIVFPREKWTTARQYKEMKQTGVYILVGYQEGEEDLPTLYIGEGDAARDRIESHIQKKDFWAQAYVFVASNSGLNKAHLRWLEHALIRRRYDMALRQRMVTGGRSDPSLLDLVMGAARSRRSHLPQSA